MKQVLLSVLIGAMVTGCAMPVARPYYMAGQSSYATNKDAMECRRMGLQEANNNGVGNNLFSELAVSRVTNDCMASLGYRR